MQVFLALSYSGIDRNRWSMKKFHLIVTDYLKTFDGVQFEDLRATTNWCMYKALVPVADEAAALQLRKDINAKCKEVSSKCRPYYFRRRKADVATVEELSLLGLTTEESIIFNNKAPKGTFRTIDV